MYTHYSSNQTYQNAFENACDCLYYGEKMYPDYYCGVPEDNRKQVWEDAYWWMAEGRRRWLGE